MFHPRKTDVWGGNLLPLLLGLALDPFSDFQRQLGQFRQRDILPGVERAEDLGHGRLYLRHEILPATVQEPPAERQISPIGLKVIAQRLREVIVVMVLQADRRGIGRGRGQRDDAGQVVPTAEEVELDSGEDGQQREGVDESKGARNCCSLSASILAPFPVPCPVLPTAHWASSGMGGIQVILTSFQSWVLFRFG